MAEQHTHEYHCLGLLAAEVLELIESVGELRIRLDAMYREIEALKAERGQRTGYIASDPPRVVTVSDSFWFGDYDD